LSRFKVTAKETVEIKEIESRPVTKKQEVGELGKTEDDQS